MNDDDIWNGYRLGNSQENTPNINYMIAMQKSNEESLFPVSRMRTSRPTSIADSRTTSRTSLNSAQRLAAATSVCFRTS